MKAKEKNQLKMNSKQKKNTACRHQNKVNFIFKMQIFTQMASSLTQNHIQKINVNKKKICVFFFFFKLHVE